nr:response regulator transcription factor [Nakamurella lactea]
MTRTVRVLIVDDDPLVRAGLTMMLDGATTDAGSGPRGRISVVGEATDGDEVPTALDAHPCDLVLMDLRMRRVDGITATRRLQARPNAPKVVVLTTFHADEEILGALEAGAVGYLLKDTPPERIVASLVQAADGESILSPEVTRRLIDRAVGQRADAGGAGRLLAGLTEREAEIAGAIARGRTNAQIAAELYLSVATVKAYVTGVLAKLQVDNRTQVALLVQQAERG